MNYREIHPTGAAREFVECYWLLEDDGAESGSVQRVVPDGTAELIFNLGQPFDGFANGRWRAQPTCFLAGQITGPLLLRPNGPAKMLGVRFLPQGAGRMLGSPMSETTGCIVPVQDLSPILARNLDRARESASVVDQVASIEKAIEEWARINGKDDPLINEAVRQISVSRGARDLGGLAGDLGLSLRQLERRFLSVVGLSPKLFSRMRRFQSVFQVIEQDSARWADAAVRCGYYDQAHLIRDFHEFAGEAPTALLGGVDLARHFLRYARMSHFSKTESQPSW
jgi:methylphosphotriester-DNA--protein-cysteine methyltransferase